MDVRVSLVIWQLILFPQPDYKGLVIKGISEEDLESKVLNLNDIMFDVRLIFSTQVNELYKQNPSGLKDG